MINHLLNLFLREIECSTKEKLQLLDEQKINQQF